MADPEQTFTSPQTVCEILVKGERMVGQTVTVTGRLTRFRVQGRWRIFGTMCDGSEHVGLQFVKFVKFVDGLSDKLQELVDHGSPGASLTVSGEIVKSPAKGQEIELVLTDFTVFSFIKDKDSYKYGTSAMKKKTPVQWAAHMKSMRHDTYMRFRHKILQALMRVRGKLKYALYRFFEEQGFTQVDTPLLTKSDCEGAGEMFQVTTLPLDGVPLTKDGKVDYSKDFFASEAHLTVSGQLEAEALAQVLGKVFTFGPTFRAENSQTSRHLAEFWMLEPELVFSEPDLDARFSRLMDLEESMVKFVLGHVFEYCRSDLEFLESTLSPGLVERLTLVRDSEFGRVTYTEAIEILKKAVAEGKEFEEQPVWGMDLGSEHERYLSEQVFKKPVFVTHYPQDLKSFYMKADEGCAIDRVTCQAVDLLVPGIGELCGGSMREDDPEKLIAVMEKKGVPTEDLRWYIDLRKDGGLPTGGFGLGFERLVFFVTGVSSVRDVIPFPRFPKHI